jgi:hypothetical protein
MPVASNTLDLQARSTAGRARKRKPLTAREQAAKAERIAAHAERIAAMQAARPTNVAVEAIASAVEAKAKAEARSKAERDAETERCRKAVVAEMSHPQYGKRLSHFLEGSKADPVRMFNILIPNWKRVQGITVEHVQPT